MKLFCLLGISMLFLTNQPRSQSNNLSAKEMMQKAFLEAGLQKKNVFISFHASWCGPCRKMDTVLNLPEIKTLFNKGYVVVHMVVEERPEKKHLETDGGELFLKEHVPEPQGLPVWAVFGENEKLIIDSRIRAKGSDVVGDNIGCPMSREEIEYFVESLKQTSTLSDDERLEIARAFGKIKNIEF